MPWRGYFDIISCADVFVFYDCVQYSKGGWRNRNLIKTSDGVDWISVAVEKHLSNKRICDVRVARDCRWKKRITGKWEQNYRNAPNFDIASELLNTVLANNFEYLSDLNISAISDICQFLQIETPLVLSKDLELKGDRNERLISLCSALGATTYLSGPSAVSYLDEQLFKRHGIEVEYKVYDYEQYHQIGNKFVGNVSILDLIANQGQKSPEYLRSRR